MTDSILSFDLERTIALAFQRSALAFQNFVQVQLIVKQNQMMMEPIGKQVQRHVKKNQLFVELIGKQVQLNAKKNQSPMERTG